MTGSSPERVAVRPLTVVVPPDTAAARRSMPLRARRLDRLADVMESASRAQRGANGHRSVRWVLVTGETLVATLTDDRPAYVEIACDVGTRDPCRLRLEDPFVRPDGDGRVAGTPFPTSSELVDLAAHVRAFARILDGGDGLGQEDWRLAVAAAIGGSHAHPDEARGGPITFHTAASPLGPEEISRVGVGPSDDRTGPLPPPPGLPSVMLGQLKGRLPTLGLTTVPVAPPDPSEAMEALRALARLTALTGWKP